MVQSRLDKSTVHDGAEQSKVKHIATVRKVFVAMRKPWRRTK